MVKQQKIVITVDTKLHLVWINNWIFLKPLPYYLTSYLFWHEFLSDLSKHANVAKLQMTTLSYLRIYFHLMKYKSDLCVAQDLALFLVPNLALALPVLC